MPAGTQVTDAATLSGANAATATGTVTYNVYSDAACTVLQSAGTPENITTAGSLPPSAAVTLNEGGTYYWQASYSGDDISNSPSVSTCGSEVETVTGTATSVSTSLSGGGSTGASISVPAGTQVTDAATLSGAEAAAASGTVTYNVYSDAACTDPVSSGTALSITTPGTLPASAGVTLSNAGTYYWQATYSGDSSNLTSTSTCGAEIETVTGAATTSQPTTLKTQLSGSGVFGGGKCSWLGKFITVFAGAAVTDTATLTGGNASTATGTVTYTVYARVPSKWFPFWQWKPVASGGTVNVTGGVVPSSNPVTLPVGVYEWQASYSGDSSNDPSVSKFGTEAENVVPVPFCGYG